MNENDMLHTNCLKCGGHAISIPLKYGLEVGYTRYSYCEKCLSDFVRRSWKGEPIMSKKPGQPKSFTCRYCGEPVERRFKHCPGCGSEITW